MNKVQDIATSPQINARSLYQHPQTQQLSKLRSNNNELKPPKPENCENDEQRRVSKISTGPMG